MHTRTVTQPRPEPHPQLIVPLRTRVAPPGVTLPVPVHVRLTSVGLGAATMLLGLVYLTTPPRRGGPLSSSVMALMEAPLGWVMLALGGWVVLAALAQAARSSAHGVAAVVHLTYTVALVATFLQLEPPRPTVASVLSVFAFVAHGGACIDYWKRGYR